MTARDRHHIVYAHAHHTQGFELFAKCLQHYENEESFKPLSDKFKKKMKSLTEVTQFNV